MKRRLKRKSNKIIIIIVIGGVVTLGTVIFLNLNYLKDVKETYTDKINALTMEYKEKEVKVFQAKTNILAGTVLSMENVVELTVVSDQSNNYYMTTEDLGHVTLVDIKEGSWIYRDMLRENTIEDNLREVEYSTFFIGNNISQNDYFDLHIQYPNGEDYIVLSKTLAKRIDVSNQYLYLWLTPEELLNTSGAIVDCYLNQGARLYSVKYIEPTLQEASHLTYTPNTDIIGLMKKDPNIVNKAVNTLSEQGRMELEERLHLFYSEHESYEVNKQDSIYHPSKNVEALEEDSSLNKQSDSVSKVEKEEISDEAVKEEVYYVD